MTSSIQQGYEHHDDPAMASSLGHGYEHYGDLQ